MCIRDRAYNTLFSGTGKICRDEGIAIDRNDYANGYALYTLDLTADQGDEENFNLMRQGSVRLVLKFSQALATTVTVVVYAEFENVIEIAYPSFYFLVFLFLKNF